MYVKFSYSFHVKMLITFVFISVQAGFNRNAADLLREYSHTGKNSNLNRYTTCSFRPIYLEYIV